MRPRVFQESRVDMARQCVGHGARPAPLGVRWDPRRRRALAPPARRDGAAGRCSGPRGASGRRPARRRDGRRAAPESAQVGGGSGPPAPSSASRSAWGAAPCTPNTANTPTRRVQLVREEGTRRVQLVREEGTRRVQLVREGGGGGGAPPRKPAVPRRARRPGADGAARGAAGSHWCSTSGAARRGRFWRWRCESRRTSYSAPTRRSTA